METRRGRCPSGGGDQNRCQEKHSWAGDSAGALSCLGTPQWACQACSPARTETPLSQAQERSVSPPWRGQGCQLRTGVNTSFPHLSSCLTFMPESPGRPGSPSAPGGPCKKESLGSLGARAGPPASDKQKPRKSKGCAQVTQGSCRSRVRLQLLSLGRTIGLAASWQSLTLPSSWTLCLPMSAVYHTGAFGRQTRKIHDLHEVVGRKRPMVGQA